MTSTIATVTCTDSRCGGTGFTWCPGCNGWGVFRRNLKRIRQGRDTSKWPLADDLPQHHECNGTGSLACGCVPLDAEMQATLAGTMDAVEVKRWSTAHDKWVTVGIETEPTPVPPSNGDARLIAEGMNTADLDWITAIPRDPNSGHVIEVPKPDAESGQATRVVLHGLVEAYKDSWQRKWVRLSPMGRAVRGHAFVIVRNTPAVPVPAPVKATPPANDRVPYILGEMQPMDDLRKALDVLSDLAVGKDRKLGKGVHAKLFKRELVGRLGANGHAGITTLGVAVATAHVESMRKSAEHKAQAQPSWVNVTAVKFTTNDAREVASRLGKDQRDALIEGVQFGGIVVSSMNKSTVANLTVHKPLLETEVKRGRMMLTPLGRAVRNILVSAS